MVLLFWSNCWITGRIEVIAFWNYKIHDAGTKFSQGVYSPKSQPSHIIPKDNLQAQSRYCCILKYLVPCANTSPNCHPVRCSTPQPDVFLTLAHYGFHNNPGCFLQKKTKTRFFSVPKLAPHSFPNYSNTIRFYKPPQSGNAVPVVHAVLKDPAMSVPRHRRKRGLQWPWTATHQRSLTWGTKSWGF